MPPVEFEPTFSPGERPQTYSLDRTATGTGRTLWYVPEFKSKLQNSVTIPENPACHVQIAVLVLKTLQSYSSLDNTGIISCL